MRDISGLLPFLIPLVIVQYTLAIVALVHVIRHPNYKVGNKVLWILIVLCFGIIGPVLYFVIGKGEDE